jgi:hypothetical protein
MMMVARVFMRQPSTTPAQPSRPPSDRLAGGRGDEAKATRAGLPDCVIEVQSKGSYIGAKELRISMAIPISNLSMALYYVDDQAGSWSLFDLCRNAGVINPEHLDARGFAGAGGGLRLFEDRIFCFLDTPGRTDLFTNAWFLLESIAGLAEGPMAEALASFQPGHEGGLVAVLHHEDGTSLHLDDHGEVLLLSFLDHEEQAPDERLSPFFRDLPVDREAWLAQALIALGEYAQLVRRTAGKEVPPSSGPGRLLGAWSRLALAGLAMDGLDHSRVHS